jgi:hypothetical protein
MQIAIGDVVSFQSYGDYRTATVEKVSRDGRILFYGRGRFLHLESVLTIIRRKESR